LYVATLASTLAGCGAPPPDRRPVPLTLGTPIEAISADLERFIPGRMVRAGVPGLSIAVVRNLEVVWARGFGLANVLTRQSATDETIFEVASNSKAVTAYAALQLVESGQLELDTPVDRYLDDPALIEEPHAGEITVRRLLTHTSGLSNLGVGARTDTRVWLPPDRCFSYSGHGFQVLQRVIESVTGRPFDAYVDENVLAPLGMRSSGYTIPDQRIANGHVSATQVIGIFGALFLLVSLGVWALAWPVRRFAPRTRSASWGSRRALLLASLAASAVAIATLGGVWALLLVVVSLLLVLFVARSARRLRSQGGASFTAARLASIVAAGALLGMVVTRPAIPLPVRQLDIPAAGGLRSTATDLARFLIELMDPSRLDPDAVREMLSAQARINPSMSWGLGIGIQHGEIGDSIWHWGQNPGYESLMIAYPEQKIGVVILTNGGPGLEIASEIAQRAIGGDPHTGWAEVPGTFLPARCAG
jgi:CubicO group peptidase (beta-lactamase class C family)